METYFKKQNKIKPGEPIPEEVRREVWERCHGRCEYCGKKAVDPHHIVPRSQNGSNEKENLIALCRKCHDTPKIKQEIAENPTKFIGRYKW